MLDALDVLIAFVTIILALSLIVTTFIQIWQSLREWRGSTLCTALSEMIEQMPLDQSVQWAKGEANEITEQLLRLRSVSPDGKRLGQVIDLKLLPLLLTDVQAKLRAAGNVELADKAQAVQERLEREQREGAKAREVVDEFRRRQDNAGQASPTSLATATDDVRALSTVAETLEGALGEVLKDGKDEVNRFLQQGKSRAEARFDIFIASAQERFKRGTQRAGLIIALVLCLLYRIDAFAVLKGISSSPGELGSLAEEMSVQIAGESIHMGVGRPMKDLNLSVLASIADDLDPQHPGAAKAVADIPNTASLGRQELEEAIASALRSHTVQQDRAQEIFDDLYDKALLASQKDLLEQQRLWKEQIAASAAFPVFRPRAPIWEEPSDWFSVDELRGLLGYILSALLVSLGAPFWFKILQNLLNLRPVLASMIEKENSTSDRPGASARKPGSPAKSG